MAVRTQEQINELGFQALVAALGKQDAIRFIRGISGVRTGGELSEADTPLPAYDPEEAHQRIMDMRDPSDQAHLL